MTYKMLTYNGYCIYLNYTNAFQISSLMSLEFQIETNSQIRSIVVDKARDQPSCDAAVGLFTLPNLRTLHLWNDLFDKCFFTGMVNAASLSMV